MQYDQQTTLPGIRWLVGHIKLLNRGVGRVNGRLPGDAHRSGADKCHSDVLWRNGERTYRQRMRGYELHVLHFMDDGGLGIKQTIRIAATNKNTHDPITVEFQRGWR